MPRSILILGAGIAGLCSALALSGKGHTITLIEKDPPPPEGGADVAFADWKHAGVGHLRHSHAFLARLRTLIKASHPALLDALAAAGCRELKFADGLPEPMREIYRPAPGDDDLAVLTSRRTTLELVIRRYVEGLEGVEIRSGLIVKEVLIEGAGATRRVAGVRIDGEPPSEIRADITVDAGGRLSNVPDQLREAGAVIEEEREAGGILYSTRHYRLKDGQGEPPRGRTSGTGDLGYIKYGLFPADNGWFSVTLAVPEVQAYLRQKVVSPEIFDAICNMMPGLAIWVDPARAEPMSRVYGMGDLVGHWRRFVTDAGPAALDYFPIGDVMIRTNPLYGRGCSFAAVSAFVLAEVIGADAAPAARAKLYQDRIATALGPYFKNMRNGDRAAIKRAAAIVDPSLRRKPNLLSKLGRSFAEDGVAIALRSDPVLFRAAMRDFHMLERPGLWLRNPANMMRIVRWWMRGKAANADRYPPKVGPEREPFFAALGLEPRAEAAPAGAT